MFLFYFLFSLPYLIYYPDSSLYGKNHQLYSFCFSNYSLENRENKNNSSLLIFQLAKDFKNSFLAPFKFDWRNSLFFLLSTGVTLLLISEDEDIYREIKRVQKHNAWISDISPSLSKIGEEFMPLSFVLIGAGGFILKNEKMKNTGYIGIMASVVTGIWIQLGKYLSGRSRPSVHQGKDFWYGPYTSITRYKKGIMPKYDAFPSGHTALAFTWAKVISEQYKNVFVKIFTYSLATGVGLSRITEDTHWLSDVFAGAVIGYTTGKNLCSLFIKNKTQKISLFPFIGDGKNYKIIFKFHF